MTCCGRSTPKMVIVHVSGFGQEGDPKMVKRAAYDLTVMAYSGIIMQNGTEEQPMLPGPYMPATTSTRS